MHANMTRTHPERLRIILFAVIGTVALMSVLVFGIRNLGTTAMETAIEPAPPQPVLAPAAPTGAERPQDAAPVVVQDATSGQALQGQAPPGNEEPNAASGIDSQAENVVALVNGEVIDIASLDIMRRSDLAMTELLSQPSSDGDNALLERLINGALVSQAARAAGFSLTTDQVDRSLTSFLSQRGKSTSDLQAVLAIHDLSQEEFTGYFSRLLMIDGFLRSQSQSLGVTPQEYLQNLQQQARISFGPGSVTIPASTPEETAVPPENETVSSTGDSSTHESTPAEGSADAPAASVEQETAAEIPTRLEYGTAPGNFAPLFDLQAMNYSGERLALSDLVGQPLLLSFWTTWCPYCRRQTPVLVEAYSRYRDQGVQFVGIDVKESQAPVANYIEAHQMEYPVVLDNEGEVATRYEVRGFPTTYFVDTKGRIVARHVGQLSPEQVNTYLDQLLAVANQ